MVAIATPPKTGMQLLAGDLDAAEQKYRQAVVKAVETGETPKNLAPLLANAGRTRADFARHYDRLMARRLAVEAIERADELEKTVPELEQQLAAADEAIAGLKEKHRQQLEPVVLEHQARSREFRRLQDELIKMRSESRQTLETTKSPYRVAQWTKLHDKAVKARNKYRELQGGETARREKAVVEAQQVVDEVQAHLARVEENHPARVDLASDFREKLEAAQQNLAKAQAKVDEIAEAERLANEAEATVKRFQQGGYDWRHANFDD